MIGDKIKQFEQLEKERSLLLSTKKLYSKERSALQNPDNELETQIEAINTRFVRHVMDTPQYQINLDGLGLTRIPQPLQQFISNHLDVIKEISTDNAELFDVLQRFFPALTILLNDAAHINLRRYTPAASTRVGVHITDDVNAEKHKRVPPQKNKI